VEDPYEEKPIDIDFDEEVEIEAEEEDPLDRLTSNEEL